MLTVASKRVTLKPVSPLADFSYDYQDLLLTPLQKGQQSQAR